MTRLNIKTIKITLFFVSLFASSDSVQAFRGGGFHGGFHDEGFHHAPAFVHGPGFGRAYPGLWHPGFGFYYGPRRVFNWGAPYWFYGSLGLFYSPLYDYWYWNNLGVAVTYATANTLVIYRNSPRPIYFAVYEKSVSGWVRVESPKVADGTGSLRVSIANQNPDSIIVMSNDIVQLQAALSDDDTQQLAVIQPSMRVNSSTNNDPNRLEQIQQDIDSKKAQLNQPEQ